MLLTGEFSGISSPLEREREREEPVEASLRESERVTVRARGTGGLNMFPPLSYDLWSDAI